MVSSILIVTVSEVTIISTYNQLCAEVSFSPLFSFVSSLLSSSFPFFKGKSKLILLTRITTGGGKASSPEAVVLSGFSPTVYGTTASNYTLRALCQVCCFSATASWRALSMGC